MLVGDDRTMLPRGKNLDDDLRKGRFVYAPPIILNLVETPADCRVRETYATLWSHDVSIPV